MTDEVFQMMHWYCALLTPSRNTAFESGCFCNSAFFLLRQRSESNNIGDWLIQSKKDGNDQESIQSNTTPDPGYKWESNKLTVRHHRRELRSQDNLQIYYSSASATVLSKEVRKTATIRNRYNQIPHLTQDTNGKVTNSQLDITDES